LEERGREQEKRDEASFSHEGEGIQGWGLKNESEGGDYFFKLFSFDNNLKKNIILLLLSIKSCLW